MSQACYDALLLLLLLLLMMMNGKWSEKQFSIGFQFRS
jgi:hypothetical protein